MITTVRRQGKYRPALTLPGGELAVGRWPQDLGTTGEAPYIANLAIAVRGIAEVKLAAGRADAANATHVWEVEPVKSWRHGAQQAYAYSAMSGLSPALALFGNADYLSIYLEVRDKMCGLQLWVWRQGRFELTTSRVSAKIVYRP